ncbi:hypothetical protein BYT27DRAFT_7183368 [Phlegmacium glaucopus]|nr:hypothetical protein BYT27DRAFT_7183368 [Phlegmacium glaucopus]
MEDMNVPALREFYQNVYSQDQVVAPSSSTMPGVAWPSMRDSGGVGIGPILLEDDTLDAAYREAILRARDVKAMAGITVATQRGIQSLPMSREVSLYKGLPNGWQFRHDDYASAHAEFIQTRHLPVQDSDLRNPRPRVPSIVPLWGPNDFPHPHPEFDNSNDAGLTEADILPPLCGQNRDPYPPMTMQQYILLASNQRLGGEGEITHQIDPALMAVSAAAAYDRSEDTLIMEVPVGAGPAPESSHPSSSAVKRAAVPPRLNLDGLPTERTFQTLLDYHESLGEGNASPHSPMMNWHPGNPSPASSFGSLSYIASPTNSLSPPTTALPTPVDEYGTDVPGNFVKGKGRLTLPETTEMELSSSTDAACGL